MAASIATQGSPSSNPEINKPSLFNSQYGLSTSCPPAFAGDHRYQQETKEGSKAPAFLLGCKGGDLSEEVRSKSALNLHRVSRPIPIAGRQDSESGTECSYSNSGQFATAPIQEEGPPKVFFQVASFKLRREDLCRGICRSDYARLIEKTIVLYINKVEVDVELEIKPFISPDENFIAVQTYYNFPEGKRSRKKLQNVINGYRTCFAKVQVLVKDPKTGLLIAEAVGKSEPIGPDDPVCYVEISNLVPHNKIIYSISKYISFEVRVEIVCTEKITAREALDQDSVVVEYH